MALRKCAACDANLPASATARARYCSAKCRVYASRTKADAVPLALVTASPQPGERPVDTPAPLTRLQALEDAAARLVKLLNEADPRTGPALNKEYRETLRELDSLRTAAAAEAGVNERTSGHRRSFDASAI